MRTDSKPARRPAPKRSRWKYWVPALITIPLALAAAPWLIGPSCPREIVILAGPEDGAYSNFAKQYARLLKRDGITLRIETTAGSIENRHRMCSSDKAVLAIMQGGTANDHLRQKAHALASLYHEPVWIFHRRSIPLKQLQQLRGRKIAIGPEGSGTRSIAEMLLKDNGIEISGDSARTIVPLGGRAAAKALQEGQIDAAFFVISPKSQYIRRLMNSPDVALFSFERADAYLRRHRFLARVTLAQGAIDLERNLPRTDTVLLAPTANLVARKDLHPALVPPLLKAAREIHERGGLLDDTSEFPNDRHTDLTMNAGARRFLKSGPTLLYRYLPFRWAVRFDRLKLMLLPLCTLLIPLIKLAPPLYRWRIRSRIFRMYEVLRDVEQTLHRNPDEAEIYEQIRRLNALDGEVAGLSVPNSYMAEYYDLRLHTAYLQDRAKQMLLQQDDSISTHKLAA